MAPIRGCSMKVDLFCFNGDGGHRAAALASQAVIAEQRRPRTIELVDLFEVLDPRGQFQRFTGMAPERTTTYVWRRDGRSASVRNSRL